MAVRICPRFCFCGESISKNAFRRFESGYRPETHLQNSEKLQSPKIAPSFRHHRPYIRLRRNFPRPSPGEPAPRSSGGETEPTPLRGASRLGRMGDYPSQQKRHADGVPFLLCCVSDLDAKPCVADLDARRFCRGYTNPLAMMGVALDRYLPGRNAMLATSPMYSQLDNLV